MIRINTCALVFCMSLNFSNTFGMPMGLDETIDRYSNEIGVSVNAFSQAGRSIIDLGKLFDGILPDKNSRMKLPYDPSMFFTGESERHRVYPQKR